MGFIALASAPVYAALLAWRIASAGERALAFLLFALAARYLLSAFPQIAQKPVGAGFSVIALSTLAIIALGLSVIDRRYLRLRLLLPFYTFVAVLTISGILNTEVKGLAISGMRLVYLLVLQIAVLQALDALGPRRVFGAMLAVFSLPLALQGASFVLGLDKRSLGSELAEAPVELGVQGINFIGTYGHESGFSMIALTALLAVVLWRRTGSALFWALLIAAAASIYLANYRTTMLAAVPLLAAVVIAHQARQVQPGQRAFVAMVAVCIALPLLGGFASSAGVAERFAGIATLDLSLLTQSPALQTAAERDLLSGRLYIWADYIYRVHTADLAHQLIGFGPGSWQGVIRLYAHNTFVSYLYEIGWLGLAAFVVYWLGNLRMALMAPDGWDRLVLLSAHLGFTIFNLATMPLWQVEGIIFFALLNGMTLHLALGAQTPVRRPAPSAASTHASDPVRLAGDPHAR